MELVYNTRIQLNAAVAYEGATALCVEMDNSVYEFRVNAPAYEINNASVLATGAGGNSRWVGVSGRGKYNSHRNLLKAKPDMTVSRLSDLKALTASENIQVFCVDTETIYNYYHSLPNVPINGLSVVDVNSSSVARWIGIYGVYTYVNLDNINFIEIEFEESGGGGGISINEPYLVFYQEFPWNAGNTYTVTGVANGVLGLPFDTNKIAVSKLVSVVLPNGNPVYDNLFPRTKAHLVTGSINNSGVVTLSAVPYNGYTAIRIYFYYEITSNEIISAYYRDDIVTSMEASVLEFARDVQIENNLSLFAPSITNVEDALNNLRSDLNGGGSGTVTNVTVTTANGFSGTVATSTTTPAISIGTTVSGILKGNGSTVSAAVADTDYQSPNIAITGATNTKITYDSKGLVTSGSAATTADINDSANRRYVTDAQLVVVGNTSGTNTGDETTATIKTKLGAATTSLDGYLTSTDWNTFNGKVSSSSLSTDNAVVRFDSTTGKIVQNSVVIIDDTGNVSGAVRVSVRDVQFTALASPPSLAANGDAYFDSGYKCVMYYDGTRSKWLSVETVIYTVSRDSVIGSGVSLQSNGVALSSSPLRLGPEDMCLVGVNTSTAVPENWTLGIADVSGGSGNILSKVIDDGSGGSVIFHSDFALNQNFNLNDAIDVFISSLGTSGNINRPIVQLIFKKRK